jgi:hypothetical protein
MDDLPLEELVVNAVLPLMLLQIMIVWGYVIWAGRMWPGMPRREALLFAPAVLPLTFILFFYGLSLPTSGPSGAITARLAATVAAAWLAGIPTGEIVYRRMKRRAARIGCGFPR